MRKPDALVLGAFVLAVALGAFAALSGRPAPGNAPEGRPAPRRLDAAGAAKADLSLREAAWYEKRGGGDVQCLLCPRLCLLAPGERGWCRVRFDDGGTLRSLVYGRLAAVHVDPVEKKPLFHFLPGTSAFSVATAGCDLACAFCQNWSISQAYPEDVPAQELTPRELVDAAKRAGCRSIAYTYNEPTVFYEYMLECARLARAEGLKNVWVTAAYINPAPLRELAPWVDAANVDIKGIRDAFYRKHCDGSVQPVLDAIRILRDAGVHVEVTNLVIPGGNDAPEDLRDLAAWVRRELGPDAVLHFSRYFPSYRMEQPGPTPESTLLEARRIAREEGLRYVYIGNLPGAGYEDTVCPSCGRTLVRREGFRVDASGYGIVGGNCRHCGAEVPGVWK